MKEWGDPVSARDTRSIRREAMFWALALLLGAVTGGILVLDQLDIHPLSVMAPMTRQVAL